MRPGHRGGMMAKPNRPSDKEAPTVATERRTSTARRSTGGNAGSTSKPAAPKATPVEIRQDEGGMYHLGGNFGGTFVPFASIAVSDVEAAQANTAANADEAA